MEDSAAIENKVGPKKRIVLIPLLVVLLVLAFFAGLGWLALRAYLPINPVNPYFPNTDDRIGAVHWNLGEFQPVYLFSFSNKNDYFLKVAYRDADQKIRLMNVLVGRSGVDSIPFSIIGTDVNNPVEVSSVGEYGKYFKIGSRVHITYLRNVLKRPGDAVDIIEPNAENTKGMCDLSKTLCYSVSLAQINAIELWNFPITKSFPVSLPFPAVWLSNKLIK